MDLLRLLVMVAPVVIIGTLMWVGTRVWRNPRNAALRGEIEAQVCFATKLDGASLLGTRGFRGFGGTRGRWIRLQGPRRLTVGTDAFMIYAPNALREFVLRGRECSIEFSQEPSRFVNRDWIVITGQAAGRQVQLAITRHNLLEVWQALAGTGAALVGQPRLQLRGAVVPRPP